MGIPEFDPAYGRTVPLAEGIARLTANNPSPFTFFGTNGYLVGREFYEMVAIRRMTPQDAIVLRKRFGGRVVIAGALGTCQARPQLSGSLPTTISARKPPGAAFRWA